MIRKYLLPVLAIAGLAFAIWMVKQAAKPVIPAKPVAEPARSPFANKISGAGIVEASTRNISIGSDVPGIVARVFVSVGKRVKAGEPLFVLDDRKQQADFVVKEAALAEACGKVGQTETGPARRGPASSPGQSQRSRSNSRRRAAPTSDYREVKRRPGHCHRRCD